MKPEEAELHKWKFAIESKPELYRGEVNDIPLIPKHLLPKLAEEFDFIREWLEIPPKQYLEILQNPKLLDLINNEFDKKIVREHDARKVVFLITNMRNVENLNKGSDNLLINAKSGTGKDHLGEGIFEILPEAEKEELIRTTPKVLAYTRNRTKVPNATWKKTTLRMEDVSNSVLTDDSFKVILTANPNKINKAKTMIKQTIQEIEIEGKPSIIMTLASPNIKEEFLRRVGVLFLDEGVNQTKEILLRQIEFAKIGKSLEYDEDIKNAIGSLKRVKVKIPFADKLFQIFENSLENVIVRTAFPRFLDYIKTATSLFQYQREIDEEGYHIATKEDYELGALCLKKTTNNLLMIPLSKLDKQIYDFFKEEELTKVSLDDLLDKEEIQHLSISERWLRFRLDFLVSKGFLIRSSEHRHGSFKPINIYSFSEIGVFNIPKYDELSSNSEMDSFTSFSSNSSNTNNNKKEEFITSNTIPTFTRKKGVNEVFEVNEPELNKHKKEEFL